MTQHAALTLERWSRFTLDQQVLMIANEMNRTSKFLGPGDEVRRRNAYERALALVDLTIEANPARGLRRELLRWRDLLAALYTGAAWCPEAHAAAFRALLRFTPAASRQLPHVSGASGD
jgi:hypothetical protein